MAKTTIISKNFGSFSLDFTNTETHATKYTATKIPIEDGRNISDHVYKDSETVTISGIISREDINQYKADPTSDRLNNLVNRFINATSLNGLRLGRSYTSKLAKVANNTLNKLQNYRGLFTRYVNKGGNQMTNKIDVLNNISETRDTVTLITQAKTYNNMIITNINLTQSTDYKINASITLEKINIVKTEFIEGLAGSFATPRNVSNLITGDNPTTTQNNNQTDNQGVLSAIDKLGNNEPSGQYKQALKDRIESNRKENQLKRQYLQKLKGV